MGCVLHKHLSSEGQISAYNTVSQVGDDVGPKADQPERKEVLEIIIRLLWREL